MSFRDIIKQIREVDPTDNYLVKIVKLIPAEVSAAYVAINSLLPYQDQWPILVVAGLILLVTCYFLIRWQTDSSRQAAVTCLAFLIWAVNISGNFYADQDLRAVLGVILVLSSIFLRKLLPK